MDGKRRTEVLEKVLGSLRPEKYEWEILQEVSEPRSTVKNYLRRMLKAGVIVKVHGAYAIRIRNDEPCDLH